MRKESMVWLGLALVLGGCQASRADTAEANAASVIRGKSPGDPGAGPTLCSPEEDVLISCRFKHSTQIASLCITRPSHGEPRTTRFAQGVPGETPTLQYPANGSNIPPVFRRTHLVRAGASGGFAYTFEQGDSRYGFYSEEGTYHALAGFFQALPASSKVISHQLCDMETLVISDDEAVSNLARAWQEDPRIDEYDVPRPDERGSR